MSAAAAIAAEASARRLSIRSTIRRRPTISVRGRRPPRPRRSATRPRRAAGSSTAGRSCGRELRRQALALARRGRAPPTGPSSGASPPWATRPTTGGSRASRAAARDRHAEDRAHARAHGLRSSTGPRSPGPSTTDAAHQRVGRADDRADVAGVADLVQIQAEAPPPALRGRRAVDADHARPRAQRRDRVEQLGLHVDSRPAARTRARPRPPRRRRPGPRPRRRTGPRARGACAPPACGSASASRCPCS